VQYLGFGERYHSGIISLGINVVHVIGYIFLRVNLVHIAGEKAWIK
jgi:hypothetical protein